MSDTLTREQIEQAAKIIEASVIAHWQHDMGDGYGGFNSITVASEILPRLEALAHREKPDSATEEVAAWMIKNSYPTGHGDTVADMLGELEFQAKTAMRETAAKKVADMDAWRDCEQLGIMDPTTGVRECSIDNKGGDCLCQERYQAFEDAAGKIRALPIRSKP